MGLSRVQIQILPERQFPRNVNMVMSRSLAQKLEIKTQPFWVTYGSAAESGMIALSPIHSNLIRMSSRLASQLRMTNQSLINAQFDPHYLRLRFGPLFGILINAHPQEKHEQAFGAISKFLDECAATGQTRGVRVAVFPPEHVRIESKSIQGWIREKGKWVRAPLPLPDVIYNRITSRKVEQQQSLQKKLEYLRTRYRIPIFNEKFLNKYQVHQILIKDDRIRSMLPETVPFHVNRLKEMFQRYPVLYLKPNNGSLGSGIIRVIKGAGNWVYQSATPNGTLTRSTKTLAEMAKLLSRRIGRQTYLIQQGLNLVTFENRQVDFRVLAQKNEQGKWQVTSSVGRIANDQHIVSNLARGGTIRKAADVLADLRHVANKPTITELRRIALEISNAFERLAEGHFAELGIDLALDKNGKVWLIEINSKPSKTDDTVTNPTLTTRPSVNRLIDYICFLAGLNHKKSSPYSHSKKPRRRKPL
ncbi:YheC/YheD family protein [Paenactinomyces guangxiensis]|uniref:YheC/YheD family protein n=1 Tax=Paenactinomyces guangxiensis TaxID=1490290 RepID=A0A7W1WSG7_9BACL|nr:YheC/YheD family protein [Paenactinomyces guangxiensis]MBA4495252.1 YheC/YheD family protein [Paenactinomyces guangxiensis]MBH8592336.1 YheC/YheD family protein [Paenactinomyces guangxiensis]